MSRIVLVTGAGRGIGAAVARAEAARGATVVVNFATSSGPAAALAAELGNGSIAVQADIAVEREVIALFEQVDDLGTIDVLVNNAGVAGGYGGVEIVHEDMLARLFAVNVGGAFLCAREAAVRMRTDRGGRGGCICNISSKAAIIGGAGEWVHYAATKGALDTMTVGLAHELAPHGVRVNAARPGLIVTDFHDNAAPGRLERMAPQIPMLRSGTPEEVAAAVAWLCSDEAGYVTGTFVDVAGGR